MEAVKQGSAAVGLKVHKFSDENQHCIWSCQTVSSMQCLRSMFNQRHMMRTSAACIDVLHVGLQSKTHVVLATLRRSPEELSSHHPKMFKIDDHLGVAVSGLNSDGRSLSRYMRTETLNHRLHLLLLTFCGSYFSPL